MKCPRCGRDLPYGSTYCLFCDRAVNVSESAHRVDDATRAMPPIKNSGGVTSKMPGGDRAGDGAGSSRETKSGSRNRGSSGGKGGAGKGATRLDGKKIMLLAGTAAIAAVMLVFVIVLIRSCVSSGKDSERGFGNPNNGGGVVAPPSYNQPAAPDPGPSASQSGGSSSKAPASSAATSSSPAEPDVTAKAAYGYLASSYAEIVKAFGEPAGRDENSGAYIFNNCEFRFIFESDGTPAGSDPVSSIVVRGGEVVSGVKIGMNYGEISEKLGDDAAASLQFDQESESWIVTVYYGNALITFYLNAGTDVTDKDEAEKAASVAAFITAG